MKLKELVQTKTQFSSRLLYATKPSDASICPIKNQFETPALLLERHCVYTCEEMVNARTVALSQPISSVMMHGPGRNEEWLPACALSALDFQAACEVRGGGNLECDFEHALL